ncbi:threonine-phosphate decarboxylase CobD [uncultured Endozoicomonas sp.]|uniref:threonine-phosphate decarboxylase CobD n=1 Tax=uncultured Endozoicomonas sp. TaxID=432652 RepID=UPI00260610DD|nr:threonine-phosphate decarboxylase CobD [uncultured Endozoicomonas sp.]
MLNHGGKLRAASVRYQIPLSDWVDLSTGVNPQCYPIPEIPLVSWNRLPEDDDGLIEAAASYYGCNSILPVAGSQAAIQSLPVIRRQLFPDSNTIAIPAIGYREHFHAWSQQGYEILTYEDEPTEAQLHQADVVLIINPNNPTGHLIDPKKLLSWHDQLSKRQAWLVIDEAFMDCSPEHSLTDKVPCSGLILLRSIGKFFGLAGIRLGFVLAEKSVLTCLQEHLGPWTINGPSRFIAQQALKDDIWQQQNMTRLKTSGNRLLKLLQEHFSKVYGTPMFATVFTDRACVLHESLCKKGIFTRLLDDESGIRFGLPRNTDDWHRLASGLQRTC